MKFFRAIAIVFFVIGLLIMFTLPDTSQTVETNENLFDLGSLIVIFSTITFISLFVIEKLKKPTE
ncbi:hypothetical protein KFE94_13605 [bacterium SCSIO 12643]|nr:hypothetical protein KFE94_13605 [bacterium SCSIO 12643]